jgi:N-acetylmuramic acid 6-phosphate etherase
MVKMGRVTGNWMTWVNISNKKLLDRGIRLIADLCGLEYRKACIELFISQEELKSVPPDAPSPSPVQYTIQRLRNEKQSAAEEGNLNADDQEEVTL